MRVEWDTDPDFPHPREASTHNSEGDDFTAVVQLGGLDPSTHYYYRVRFVDSENQRSQPEHGEFRTAPHLTSEIRDAAGRPRYGSRLELKPE
jgi:phosphodiesterase/alkaline phosphatase D-like protein